MVCSMNDQNPPRPFAKGFTLVELLIVIAMISVLAMLVSYGASRFIESGKKVQALFLLKIKRCDGYPI